jgi:hypothetical protein
MTIMIYGCMKVDLAGAVCSRRERKVQPEIQYPSHLVSYFIHSLIIFFSGLIPRQWVEQTWTWGHRVEIGT